MLAEGIARERYEMEVRDKAQEKVSVTSDQLCPYYRLEMVKIYSHYHGFLRRLERRYLLMTTNASVLIDFLKFFQSLSLP